MSYKIDVLSDLPVLLSIWGHEFEFKQDVHAYSDDVKQVLDSTSEPLHYMLDFREWKDISLDNVMVAAELAARSGNSNFHHPMARSVIFVTTSTLLDLVAQGMGHDIYGSLNIHVFDSVEAALDSIRVGQIA